MTVPDSLPLYDHAQLYDCLRMPVGDLPFYAELAQKATGPVLDLACGTGRIALGLARQGLLVTAVDRAPAMLDWARQKALELSSQHQPQFALADMTTFELPQQFGLVLIAFNSLQHLYSNDRILACLERIGAHLAPGGSLAFDVMNPDLQILSQSGDDPYRVGGFAHPVTRQPVDVYEQLHYDRASQICRVTLRFEEQGAPPVEVVQHVRMLFPQELDYLLRQTGWRVAAKYGDFARAGFVSGSLKQVFVCQPGHSQASDWVP